MWNKLQNFGIDNVSGVTGATLNLHFQRVEGANATAGDVQVAVTENGLRQPHSDLVQRLTLQRRSVQM